MCIRSRKNSVFPQKVKWMKKSGHTYIPNVQRTDRSFSLVKREILELRVRINNTLTRSHNSYIRFSLNFRYDVTESLIK